MSNANDKREHRERPYATAQVSAAVSRACPGARRLESYRAPNGHYLRFATTGKLGTDNVEFLIKYEGIGDRGWEGDEKSEKDWLVRATYNGGRDHDATRTELFLQLSNWSHMVEHACLYSSTLKQR